MRVGSLVKHKMTDRLGLVYKCFWEGEVFYVKWAFEDGEFISTRQKPKNIEVIHE